MHSIWNAMDLLETRVAHRLLSRWQLPEGFEVPPADVVLRDGTVSPQDRDFYQYARPWAYGNIVRDLISISWEAARKCRDDQQTVVGVVKAAQLDVFAPVINWFAAQISAKENGQIRAWPLQMMNLLEDQALLTRLLTAGRRKEDPWFRTCVLLRPFYALARRVPDSQEESPSAWVTRLYNAALEHPEDLSPERKLFWETLFRPESDPYVKMLDEVAYGNFFLAAVPRLDTEKFLPRVEFVVPSSLSRADPWSCAQFHRDRAINALQQVGFDVSAEHTMFRSPDHLDILPSLLIRAHDTVKIWAAELLERVQEFIGSVLAKYVNTKRLRGIRIRPFSRQELELLYEQLRKEREIQAGTRSADQLGNGAKE